MLRGLQLLLVCALWFLGVCTLSGAVCTAVAFGRNVQEPSVPLRFALIPRLCHGPLVFQQIVFMRKSFFSETKATIETFRVEIDKHELQQFHVVIAFLRPVHDSSPL